MCALAKKCAGKPMVSCLMGDSTALASAIVRCCLKRKATGGGWQGRSTRLTPEPLALPATCDGMATARITAKAAYHDQRIWVMASKPPQLVCTQHPAPPVLPSLFGIMARSACTALHTRNVPAADMRRGTPFFQGAVGCLPGIPFRLHLFPRFPPSFLPQKTAPRRLKA